MPSKARPPSPPPAKPATTSTKLNRIIAMLRRLEGATIAQMTAETGWQDKTVRGCIAGTLKRKKKLTVTSEKTEAGRTYRIVEPAS